MLDSASNMISTADAYYFQLYPLSLAVTNPECDLPSPGTTYRFTILKGQQKFDQTKLPIEANFKNVNGKNVMVLPRCPVNFYIPSYNKNKGAEFLFNMYQTENRTEYFIADQTIPIAPYIDQYKKNRTQRFQHTGSFSDDYELQYEVYVEKSRIALEKVVKEYKNERSLKSPLRERPEQKAAAGPKKAFANKQNPVQQQKKEVDVAPSEKEQATQLTSSHNKKVESVGQSINQEETVKEEAKPTARTYNEEESDRHFQKKESSVKEQPFAKKPSKQPSEASKKDDVPSLAVHFKALTKNQSEIKMSSSQRLPQTGSTIEEKEVSSEHKSSESKRQKILMALFLAISMIIMYFSMHPNRKV